MSPNLDYSLVNTTKIDDTLFAEDQQSATPQTLSIFATLSRNTSFPEFLSNRHNLRTSAPEQTPNAPETVVTPAENEINQITSSANKIREENTRPHGISQTLATAPQTRENTTQTFSVPINTTTKFESSNKTEKTTPQTFLLPSPTQILTTKTPQTLTSTVNTHDMFDE